MKTLKLTAAFFIAGTISLCAQDVKWIYNRDGSHHNDDEAGFTCQGHDGKIYASGAINEDSAQQPFVVRLDLQGNELWNFTDTLEKSFLFIGTQDTNMNLYFGGQTNN